MRGGASPPYDLHTPGTANIRVATLNLRELDIGDDQPFGTLGEAHPDIVAGLKVFDAAAPQRLDMDEKISRRVRFRGWRSRGRWCRVGRPFDLGRLEEGPSRGAGEAGLRRPSARSWLAGPDRPGRAAMTLVASEVREHRRPPLPPGPLLAGRRHRFIEFDDLADLPALRPASPRRGR